MCTPALPGKCGGRLHQPVVLYKGTSQSRQLCEAVCCLKDRQTHSPSVHAPSLMHTHTRLSIHGQLCVCIQTEWPSALCGLTPHRWRSHSMHNPVEHGRKKELGLVGKWVLGLHNVVWLRDDLLYVRMKAEELRLGLPFRPCASMFLLTLSVSA